MLLVACMGQQNDVCGLMEIIANPMSMPPLHPHTQRIAHMHYVCPASEVFQRLVEKY